MMTHEKRTQTELLLRFTVNDNGTITPMLRSEKGGSLRSHVILLQVPPKVKGMVRYR